MNRTQAALLEGAQRAVEVNGTKITMGQVAAGAGVAKATLYNHFRTREAVLSALLTDEVNALIEGLADRPVADALRDAAASLSENPMLHALARLEPATLAALARVDASAEGWRKAREAVTSVLGRADREGADIVLRWLASHVMTPASGAAIAADVDILLTGLPARRAAEQAASA